MDVSRENEIEARLKELENEKEELLSELQKINATKNNNCHSNLTSIEKIKLFRSLFKGREDVYARRWENVKTGKSGYFPARKNNETLPITDDVIKSHLQGVNLKEPCFYGQKQDFIMGIYPLLLDEKCYFLAIDFDKSDWQKDVQVFIQSCEEFDVPAYIERSRSGNGAHIWFFFKNSIPAYLARHLGTFLINCTMDKHPEIGFSSYDRLFPNQDTMPKGGFGNLIALPLQNKARQQCYSVFVDKNFIPYPDQWQFLSTISKINEAKTSKVLENYHGLNLNDSFTEETEFEDKPWIIKPKVKDDFSGITLPSKVTVVLSNQIYIQKENLPPKLINKILKLAAFKNPEFYKAQAMRFSTYDKPRIISCAEILAKYITLPRGCTNDLQELLSSLNISMEIQDERTSGTKIKTKFVGKLRKEQTEVLNKILKNDIGILSAPTAFGKTVIAADLISKRKVKGTSKNTGIN